MEKFKLDNYMVRSIEYFKDIEYLSLYGILEGINTDDRSDGEFYYHAQKVLKYFNEFDNKSDDENFMKCLLGHYEEIRKSFRIICPVCKEEEKLSVFSASIECHNCDFIEEI